MKRTLKKSMSILLAFTLLFGSLAFGFSDADFADFAVKAEAVEASDLPEDFDLNYYNVSKIFIDIDCNTYNDFLSNRKQWSPAKGLYNGLSNDATFSNSVKAWEAVRIVANPSNLVEHLEFQQQYEEVIFSVLFSALGNAEYEEMEYNDILSTTTGLTDNLLSVDKTAKLLSKTSLSLNDKDELKDTALAFLTNGKDVENKWSAFGEYSGIINKYSSIVDKAFELGTEAVNIINSASMYVSLLDSGAEVLDYLNDLKAEAPNAVFSAAVSTVIRTISQDWLGIVEKVIFDSGFVLGKEVTKELVEYAWNICCTSCPFLLGMSLGEQFGTWACNVLFETEDTIEQFEYLKILVQIDEAATKLFEKYGNSCKTSLNSTNAAQLMFATDFSWTAYCLGSDASVEYFNITLNKGLVNKIESIIDPSAKQTFIEYEEAVYKLVNTCEINYIQMKTCWKDWIEEDYPEFAKKVDGKPDPISSIDISKDEVVVRVGEIMSIPYTVSPENHSGMYGLKSDNESVIQSSEPMDILNYAKEENIGTANVTIYSIDDPSICDTVKLTVIGKEDEAVSESESNIVTGTCGENLIWTLNENTGRLVISGTGEMWSWGSFDGSPWERLYQKIKKVTINNGVKSIGNYAFYECRSLKSVTIPNDVTGIGSEAFSLCTSLTSITIPDSVINIGSAAFSSCDSLTSVTIPDRVTSISHSTFMHCHKLTNITIPNSVTSIGDEAFYGCTSLTSVTIPDSVTSIGDSAFMYCYSLTSIAIPNSVTSIGCATFYETGYYNDESNWENDVLYIGNHIIRAKETISSSYEIKYGTVTFADYAFSDCNLTSVIIPDSITSISRSAFMYCGYLTSITIPDNITSIDYSAFYHCNSLYDVYYTGTEEEWEAITILAGNEDLTRAKIHYSYGADDMPTTEPTTKPVETTKPVIPLTTSPTTSTTEPTTKPTTPSLDSGPYTEGYYTYTVDSNGNAVITDVDESISGDITIPSSLGGYPVTSIGDKAFYDCDALTSVIIHDSITFIGCSPFCDCDNLTKITVDSANTAYSSDECGVLFNKDKTILIQFPIENERTTYNIPNSVRSIGDEAFHYCYKLTNITLPDGLTNIGEHAFYRCKSLTNVLIPESVTTIDWYAFYDCESMTSITIPASVKKISGDSVFASCDSLTSITVDSMNTAYSSDEYGVLFNKDKTILIQYPIGNTRTCYYIPNGITCIGENAFKDCENLANIIIPDSVSDIEYGAFEYCESLTSITIPGSVTSIGSYAFRGCSSLTDIYYNGTEKEWKNAIKSGHDFEYLKNVIIHFKEEPTTEPANSTTKPLELTTNPTEPTTKPSTTKPAETTNSVVKDDIIKKPSTTEVKYGETLILHADFENIPAEAKIEWSVEGEGVTIKPSADGLTCAVTSTSTGDATITAKYVDANGVEHVSEQEIESNASFWQKIVSFFKNLFGINRIIEQKIKF